jgi:hypothetical protein
MQRAGRILFLRAHLSAIRYKYLAKTEGLAAPAPRSSLIPGWGLRSMKGRRYRAFHSLSPSALANELSSRPGIRNAPLSRGH